MSSTSTVLSILLFISIYLNLYLYANTGSPLSKTESLCFGMIDLAGTEVKKAEQGSNEEGSNSLAVSYRSSTTKIEITDKRRRHDGAVKERDADVDKNERLLENEKKSKQRKQQEDGGKKMSNQEEADSSERNASRSPGKVKISNNRKNKEKQHGLSPLMWRIPSRTLHTFYDPKNDLPLRSPLWKPSWQINLPGGKSLTMDDLTFAYDLWFEENAVYQHTSWLGTVFQQDGNDVLVLQDLIYKVKPDLIIELGTNTGGGTLFYSTIMRAYQHLKKKKGKVLTIDPRPLDNWNKHEACPECQLGNQHPYWQDGGIQQITGWITNSSIEDLVAQECGKVSVVLAVDDASHAYQSTLDNINVLAKYVTPGSYLVVQDTKMDRFEQAGLYNKGRRPRHFKFGPLRAVYNFLKSHSDYEADRGLEFLQYSQHTHGFLRRKVAGN